MADFSKYVGYIDKAQELGKQMDTNDVGSFLKSSGIADKAASATGLDSNGIIAVGDLISGQKSSYAAGKQPQGTGDCITACSVVGEIIEPAGGGIVSGLVGGVGCGFVMSLFDNDIKPPTPSPYEVCRWSPKDNNTIRYCTQALRDFQGTCASDVVSLIWWLKNNSDWGKIPPTWIPPKKDNGDDNKDSLIFALFGDYTASGCPSYDYTFYNDLDKKTYYLTGFPAICYSLINAKGINIFKDVPKDIMLMYGGAYLLLAMMSVPDTKSGLTGGVNFMAMSAYADRDAKARQDLVTYAMLGQMGKLPQAHFEAVDAIAAANKGRLQASIKAASVTASSSAAAIISSIILI